MPPLARLAQLHEYLPEGSNGRAALADVLALADRFSGWLAQNEFRSDERGHRPS